MEVSDRRRYVQLTQVAKITSAFSFIRAIFALAGFVSAPATGPTDGLLKPYEGMMPAAPRALNCRRMRQFSCLLLKAAFCVRFSSVRFPFVEKGFGDSGHRYKLSRTPLQAGVFVVQKQRAPIKGTRLRMILLLRHNANDDDKNNQRNHHADDDVHRLNRHLAL